jgi:hypothetical protein
MKSKAILISSVEGLHLAKGYDILYFGHEFCEHLIPSLGDFKIAHNYAKNNNLGFTIVTPYVTDKGIKQISKIVSNFKNCEIVINDWGVLDLLQNHDLKINLGRLLTKRKKDPRISNQEFNRDILDNLTNSNLQIQEFQNFLKQHKVSRIEIDNAVQGQPTTSFPQSLYYPYVYLTTTRKCPFIGINTLSNKVTFLSGCTKECKKYSAKISNDKLGKIILKDNAQFFINNKLPKGIDRLVYIPWT